MSKRESIARYMLIVKRLKRNPASFEEILDYLKQESEIQGYNYEISKRTFKRDIEDISNLYNIEIQYDFSAKVYKIISEDQPEMTERMFEAFDTFNALNISDRISDCIYFEKRRPQGTEHLYGLLHAIKNRFLVKFAYQKYWEDISVFRTVEPYALQEFRNRWYVLAKDPKDKKIKTFALDRILALDITNNHFSRPKDFDVKEYFRYCFGIVSPNNEQPEEVILSFTPFQGKYIKSLPLHESQEILKDNNEELLIRLKLHVTHDFFMEILSFGEEVKVIQPQSLINDIKHTIKKTLTFYK